MATTPQTEAVELELRIAASPETVFSYFTDPQKILEWQGKSAELDPTSGGIYRVDMNGNDIARGEFVDVVPHSRIVFTWGWEGDGHPLPPGSSTVEITLTPDGDSTVLVLKHYGLNSEMQNAHAEGWNHYLPRLVEASEGRNPGADPWAAGKSEA